MTSERNKAVFEDLSEGSVVPELTKGPMSPLHLMRWSSAIENWHRIHYDRTFAVEHDGLPDLLVNGSFKQHVLAQLLKDWVAPDGWLRSLDFRYHGQDLVGDTITASGKVVEKAEHGGFGWVLCEIQIANDRDVVSTSGKAVVVLPLADGPALPYPFGPDISAPW